MIQLFRQSFDVGPDFIPDPPVMFQDFLFRFCIPGQGRGVVEAFVNDLCGSRKEGAVLVGMAADGDDVIKVDFLEFIEMLGTVSRDVYTGLGHDPYGFRVESMGFDSGGVRLDTVGQKVPCPSLGHLASAGVAGTEKENLDLFMLWLHDFFYQTLYTTGRTGDAALVRAIDL